MDNEWSDREKRNERLDRTEAEIKFKSGTISSWCPPYYLIPKGALDRLANVYQLGINRKGDGAWNVYSQQSALSDKDFILDRIAHVIKHALIYRDKLLGIKDWDDPKYKEDDAAAIMWGGSFLAEANKDKISLEIAVISKVTEQTKIKG